MKLRISSTKPSFLRITLASKKKLRALAALKKDDSIIITKADKGNCFIVMDRPDYDEKMQALLSTILQCMKQSRRIYLVVLKEN